ncbi:MAG: methyltransferase domain-containing protein [Byssovorax sp.]
MSGEPPEGGAPPGTPGSPFDASARGTFMARGMLPTAPDDEPVPISARVPPPPSVPRARAASYPPMAPASYPPMAPASAGRKGTLPGGATAAAVPVAAPLPRIPDLDAMIAESSRSSSPPLPIDGAGPPPIPQFLTPVPEASVLPPGKSGAADGGAAPRRKSRRTVKIPDDAVPNKTPAPPPVAFAQTPSSTPEPFAVVPAPFVPSAVPAVPPAASYGAAVPAMPPSAGPPVIPFDDIATPPPAAVMPAPPLSSPSSFDPPTPVRNVAASPVPPPPLADELATPPAPAAEASPEPSFDAPIMPMRIIAIGTDLSPLPPETPPETVAAVMTPLPAPVDVTPVEVAPARVTPLDLAPIDVKPAQVTPAQTTPVEVAPVEATPVQITPVEVAPVEVAPPRKPPPPVAPIQAVDHESVETVEPESSPESVEPELSEPVSVDPEPSAPAIQAAPRKPPPVPRVEAIEVDTLEEEDDDGAPTTQREAGAAAVARPRAEDVEEIEVERISDVVTPAGADGEAPAKKPPPPPPKRAPLETSPSAVSPPPPAARPGPPPPPVAAPAQLAAPAQTPPPAPAAPAVAQAPATAGPVSAEPQRKRQKPWWEELFGDDYIRTMDRLDPKVVRKECDFIEDRLGLEKGAVILDLACGPGSHAVELSSRGYGVVGYDLSLSMLARAADEAQERGQRLNFLHGDMREMAFEETFDGVYSWSTSFGYFDDEKNFNVLSRIHKALRKGGLLLLDVVNRDYVAPRQPSLVWFEGDGCVCMDEMVVDFFSSRLRVKRTVMFEDGRARELEYSIRLYALHELGKMLHECGFKVIEVTGHPAHPGVFFGSESPRVIVLAERG